MRNSETIERLNLLLGGERKIDVSTLDKLPEDCLNILKKIVNKLFVRFTQMRTIYGVRIGRGDWIEHDSHGMLSLCSEETIECDVCRLANRVLKHIRTLERILNYVVNYERLKAELIYLQERVDANRLW